MFEKIKIKAIRWFFEDMPLMKWLNGNKTTISRVLLFLSAVLIALQKYFPEYAPVSVEEFDAAYALLASILGLEVGKIHKEAKDK